MSYRLSLVALLTIVLAAPAHADVINFQQMSSAPFGTPQTLDLPQFNPALGELTAVRWQVRGLPMPATFALDNEQTGPVSGTFMVQSLINRFQVAGAFFDGFAASGGRPVSLGPDDEPGLPPDFDGPDSIQFQLSLGPVFTTSQPDVSPSLLPVYTGDGSVTAQFLSSPLVPFTLPGIPGVPASLRLVDSSAAIAATVSYEFTPVPEPSTLALVGLVALAGLCYGVPKLRGTLASVPPL